AAKNGGALRVVNDQRGSPTYTKDLAVPFMRLVEQEKTGIYHVANSGSCTWFEFAGEIFRLLNMDVEIIPISSDELERKAKRPAYSVFDMWKLQKKAGVKMRPWQEALKEYIGSTGAQW
ncbi:MAG TPA: sugar nucleotide-binding protein, partial [Syntrophorhabdaceae bacterium]|nr:sugar nucleotide-binding protein [Syntrophorhabdaceae bacterium]